jgi:hypothetical protein
LIVRPPCLVAARRSCLTIHRPCRLVLVLLVLVCLLPVLMALVSLLLVRLLLLLCLLHLPRHHLLRVRMHSLCLPHLLPTTRWWRRRLVLVLVLTLVLLLLPSLPVAHHLRRHR